MNKILQGDSLEELKTLESESVNCIVTSPPYWGLRSYLPDKIVLKSSLSVEEKEKIFKELTILGIKGVIR